MLPKYKVSRILIEIGAMLLLAFGINFIIHEPYLQGIVLNGILFSIVALGLQLIMGYAGQISLGQAAFVGIGAYTSVLMTKTGISFWIALPVAGLVAGLGGFLMSPIVRLAGVYFAMASLAFNISMSAVFSNWDAVTNATKGIIDIPFPTLGPITISSSGDFLTLSIIVIWLQWRVYQNISSAGFGRVLRSIGDNETAIIAAGVNTTAYKMKVIFVGCFMAGVAGAIMGHYKGIVSPEPFTIWQSIYFALMLVIGGLGSLRGAIIGAFALTIASEYIAAYAAQHRMLSYGVIMLLFMLFLPGGLDGILKKILGIVTSKFKKPVKAANRVTEEL
jgi:branched-chain amino acid transport system permease protein